MKKISKLLLLLVLFIINISSVFADSNKNIVNIYLFYSDTCPHCKQEKELLKEIEKDYDNIRIYQYEVNTDNNEEKLFDIADTLGVTVSGVPFTVIADKVFMGFSYENSKNKFLGTIEFYSNHGYEDVVGKYLSSKITSDNFNTSLDDTNKTDNLGDTNKNDYNNFMNEYGNHKISLLWFDIDTKNLTLPFVSALIGLVDGFNPCAMWILLFLISMLIGMKNKKRMWSLGITFLLTSALVYMLFMISWLKVATFLTSVTIVRVILGLVALTGAIYNIYGYIKSRKTDGCTVVNDKKRNKIFDRIKKFTTEKNFFLALIGVIALAVSVNIVELACSAGLPVMFIEILSLNYLSTFEEMIYIFIYMLFFLLDDLIVFFIAMTTMQLTGFSTKYGKLSKIVGGILLLIMGLLLIFKPGWLMFNF